jgi:hypothetical protein
MTWPGRLLCVAVALTALSGTSCGGERSAVKTVTQREISKTSTPAKEDPTGDGDTPPEVNPPFLEKKLDEGDCAGVASDTSEILASSETPTDLAEAHLFHALAIACLGDDATAELDQAEASRTLLSDESVKILDRIKAEGVPQGLAEVHDVLPPSAKIAAEP